MVCNRSASATLEQGHSIFRLDSRSLRYRDTRHFSAGCQRCSHLGPHSVTYSETDWIAKAIARLASVLNPLWSAVTTTIGHAFIRPSQMPPEVHQAWTEFKDGTLAKEVLARRLMIIQPALRMRRKGETGWQHRGRRIWAIPKD